MRWQRRNRILPLLLLSTFLLLYNRTDLTKPTRHLVESTPNTTRVTWQRPNVDVLVKTYVGDAHWLIASLRSLEVYGQLFRNVIVVFPNYEEEYFRTFLIDRRESPLGFNLNLVLISQQEVIPVGYVQQSYSKLHADEYSDADAFYIFDSDAILVRTVTWEDLYDNDKLLVRYLYWNEASKDHQKWRERTEAAIGITGNRTYMVMMGQIYPREAFVGVRKSIEELNNMSLRDFYLQEVCPKRRSLPHPVEFELHGLWLSKYGRKNIKFIHRNDDKTQYVQVVKQAWSWGGYDPMKVINNECHLRKYNNKCELLKSPCDIQVGAGCQLLHDDQRKPSCPTHK